MLDTFLATRADEQSKIAFLVDYDDPTREEYPQGYCSFAIGTGDPTGPLNYWSMHKAYAHSPILGFIGDDSRFETPGWDTRVLAALERPGFCWAMDGHDFPWPSTVFVSRAVVQTLGWFVLPGLRRGYFDVVWFELARLTQSARMLDEVMIRHDNSRGDPSKPNYDPTFRVPPEMIAADQEVFEGWLATRAGRDAQKIRRALYV